MLRPAIERGLADAQEGHRLSEGQLRVSPLEERGLLEAIGVAPVYLWPCDRLEPS